ncbi:uncharacterized protein LOC131639016 [Vicia villosa]|uniref:uncharacterized protein LOC131639016 n=1 Tax=Vicia villosa TaxID=3911 RepID=UPI00273B338A|nr:uncharacterized protein LOC131639016 [Vicia villosa]
MISGMLGWNANGAGIGVDRVIDCAEDLKVGYGTHVLSEEADDWWVTTRAKLDADGIAITWAIFKREFLRKYFPEDVRGRNEIEFLELRQDNMTVPEYAAKFVELAKYYTPYNNDEAVDKKGKKHVDRCKPYDRGKAVDWKKPSGGDSSALVRCYNCGEVGHRKNECKLEQKKCFKCDRVGHIATDCKKKTVLFPEAVSADDLNMTARQVNEAIEDGATVFMLFALMNLKEKVVRTELPVVCEFPEVFLEDVNELPPKREVEFAIELVTTVSL